MKQNKRKGNEMKGNGTVVFLKRVITFNATWTSNLEEWISFFFYNTVFHVSILLFYAQVVTLNLLYLSYHTISSSHGSLRA